MHSYLEDIVCQHLPLLPQGKSFKFFQIIEEFTFNQSNFSTMPPKKHFRFSNRGMGSLACIQWRNHLRRFISSITSNLPFLVVVASGWDDNSWGGDKMSPFAKRAGLGEVLSSRFRNVKSWRLYELIQSHESSILFRSRSLLRSGTSSWPALPHRIQHPEPSEIKGQNTNNSNIKRQVKAYLSRGVDLGSRSRPISSFANWFWEDPLSASVLVSHSRQAPPCQCQTETPYSLGPYLWASRWLEALQAYSNSTTSSNYACHTGSYSFKVRALTSFEIGSVTWKIRSIFHESRMSRLLEATYQGPETRTTEPFHLWWLSPSWQSIFANYAVA